MFNNYKPASLISTNNSRLAAGETFDNKNNNLKYQLTCSLHQARFSQVKFRKVGKTVLDVSSVMPLFFVVFFV
jgi:hypothetical protein